MSIFEITLSKSSEMDRLEHAINNGDIIACSDFHSSIFPISKDSIPGLIEDWQISYPELKTALGYWKHGNFDDDDVYSSKKFKVSTIDRGKEVLFIFLGIRPTSNKNKVECFEFSVKYEFEAYRNQRKSEAYGFLGRIFMGIGTLGISEYMFATDNANHCSREADSKNLIQRGTNADALAAMFISKSCPELKITWN
jgi:hypothetical protein